MKKQELTITPALVEKYAAYLKEQERAPQTIQKYVHDLTALSGFLAGRTVTKGLLLEWKEDLIGQYAPASVNNKLAAINGFLSFCGWNDLRLRPLKIQKALFLSEAAPAAPENPKGPLSLRGQGADEGRVCAPGPGGGAGEKRAIVPGHPDHLRHRHPGQ